MKNTFWRISDELVLFAMHCKTQIFVATFIFALLAGKEIPKFKTAIKDQRRQKKNKEMAEIHSLFKSEVKSIQRHPRNGIICDKRISALLLILSQTQC